MGDLLYSFTEWLRSTQLTELALWISETKLTGWVGMTHVGDVPVIAMLQTVHILAIAGSFASVLMINARVFGIAGHATLAETSRRYTKVLWWALLFVVITGVGMLFGDTVRNLLNSIFWIKMGLLLAGLAMALGYSRSLARQTAGGGQDVSGATKATGIILAALWCILVLAGRWIAYAPS